MENSPFRSLATELRNRIWKLAITNEEDHIDVDVSHSDGEWIQQSITRTCKQIRAESLTMFYAENRFRITIPDGCDDVESEYEAYQNPNNS